MSAATEAALPVPAREEVIARIGNAGGRIAAVYPIHYPRALLRAHGYHPVEVWGPPRTDTTRGDAHLQAYTCSIVRCGLSFLLGGKLEVADLIMVPHACDSLQGLGSVLLDFHRPRQPVLPYYVPRGEGEPALVFLTRELEALSRRLAEISGRRPDDAELSACVRREERADALLGRLLAARGHLPLDNASFYRVVRSREYLPAEEFERLALMALARRAEGGASGVPVVLSGIVPEPVEILAALDEAGALVAADDLAACGRRAYPAGHSEVPLRRLAQSLLGGPPDSTRGSPVQDRAAHLTGLAERAGARGVVFLVVKFCEPELFYLPQLRTALEARGLRAAVMEVDLADPLPHQVVTRLEAFVETLE